MACGKKKLKNSYSPKQMVVGMVNGCKIKNGYGASVSTLTTKKKKKKT